jgi:hypothetical protein
MFDPIVKNIPDMKLSGHSCSSTEVFTTGLKAEDRSVVSWSPLTMPLEKSSRIFGAENVVVSPTRFESWLRGTCNSR